MPDPFDLKIFHYHYQTGGVTTVVRQACGAFRAHLPEMRSVEAIAGEIPAPFRLSLEGIDAGYAEMPELGYRDREAGDPGEEKRRVDREARKLAEQLLHSFGSDHSVWWVHNYHLGKNPVFTQALLRIIHSGRPQRIILQIHDFPECGRFANLRLLRRALSLDPYPVTPWVRYVVLNPRDRRVLLQAGIPEQAVFLLENPVFPGSRPAAKKSIRPLLDDRFGRRFPRFDSDAPILFYPIRTIRRKNVLEALLLSVLLERRTNIVITLPGVSAAERRYSQLVEGLFADRLCAGLWGIGKELDRPGLGFDDLIAASDLVVSTSVQEGFGYLFINSLLWSLPLAARDLDTLAGFKEGLFDDFPAYFYDALRVPHSDSAGLVKGYQRKIDSLADLIPPAEGENLMEQVRTLSREGTVDYSFLPVEDQAGFLQRLAAGEKEIRSSRGANRPLLDRIEEMLASGAAGARAAHASKSAAVDDRFGGAAYAAGFRRVLESFGAAAAGGPRRREEAIAAAVLEGFLKLDHLRLLYDY